MQLVTKHPGCVVSVFSETSSGRSISGTLTDYLTSVKFNGYLLSRFLERIKPFLVLLFFCTNCIYIYCHRTGGSNRDKLQGTTNTDGR